jgi:flagellar motor switch/type III secretory pathway protein FliN
MAKVLSQEEIDQLLAAISSEDTGFEPEPPSKKIRSYDFKRPDRLTRRDVRALHYMHGELAERINLKEVDVHAVSTDQLTLEDFSRSIRNPSFIVNLESQIAGSLIFQVDKDKVASKLLKVIQKELANILGETQPLKINKKLSNPWFMEEQLPTSRIEGDNMVALITYEISEIEGEGGEEGEEYLMNIAHLNIGCNHPLIKKIRKQYTEKDNIMETKDVKFNPVDVEEFARSMGSPMAQAPKASLVDHLSAKVKASLGVARRKLSELQEASEGTIIVLDTFIQEPVLLEVDGIPYAKGEVVVVDGQFAVRITEKLVE